MAESLGLEVPPRTLGFRGYARASLGEAAGLDDMRQALATAVEQGQGRDAAIIHNNLAVVMTPIEGPAAAAAVLREGIEFAERRGIAEMATAMRAASLDALLDVGEWDRALEIAAELGERAEAAGDTADLIQVRWVQARVLARRGEVERAEPLADWLVETARESGSTEDIAAGFTSAALVYLGRGGRQDLAHDLVDEMDRAPNLRDYPAFPVYLPDAVRIAAAVGDLALAERLASGITSEYPYARHAVHTARAIVSEARGETEEAAERYADAAKRWDSFGVVPERAYALLGEGRCLVARGRHAEAEAVLRAAREALAALGARPALEETDTLLARTAAVGS